MPVEPLPLPLPRLLNPRRLPPGRPPGGPGLDALDPVQVAFLVRAAGSWHLWLVFIQDAESVFSSNVFNLDQLSIGIGVTVASLLNSLFKGRKNEEKKSVFNLNVAIFVNSFLPAASLMGKVNILPQTQSDLGVVVLHLAFKQSEFEEYRNTGITKSTASVVRYQYKSRSSQYRN